MTEIPWGMPGAQAFLAKPTAAQLARDAEIARRSALGGDWNEMGEKRAAQLKVLTDRHAAMLDGADNRILRALLGAHRPHGDGLWPTCSGCPEVEVGITQDSEPESWPCGVWMFISDRWEVP